MPTAAAPPLPADLTRREAHLIRTLRSPGAVQRWLNGLPYNTEIGGGTQRGFRGVVEHHMAHCLEAAVFAAVVLEQHGYPPLVMSLESQDHLDHVIFVHQHRGRWGAIARSRDPGLHGRRAVFPTLRALARSYLEPYVDYTGRLRGFGVANLAEAMGRYDWRWRHGNIWQVEQMLIGWPHERLPSSTKRYKELKAWYRDYRATHGGKKPTDYNGRETWAPLPREFR
ncbi:MAG: hypothetical protein IT178_01080 [Acidobacteria bacterium]|nr:hypothetical protein [Acidobacteriota bacterium]